MRGSIPEYFPPAPGLPGDPEAYLQVVENTYVTDAFHSVSIEGYQVSLQLIKRVRSGTWNPEANEADKNMRHTLAARGYWRAFQKVKESLTNIIEGGNARVIIDEDHGGLYREMFASGATAALVKACDLAGYRNVPVYIRRSRHVPLNRDAVRDAVPAFSERLAQETEPSAHVVLGHFVFLQFLLYRDGFFRICQFLKNVMLTAGGGILGRSSLWNSSPVTWLSSCLPAWIRTSFPLHDLSPDSSKADWKATPSPTAPRQKPRLTISRR